MKKLLVLALLLVSCSPTRVVKTFTIVSVGIEERRYSKTGPYAYVVNDLGWELRVQERTLDFYRSQIGKKNCYIVQSYDEPDFSLGTLEGLCEK